MLPHAGRENAGSDGRRAVLDAACWAAIAALVLGLVRPDGLLGDDEQYLYLVKGFVTGRPFLNLHDMDGSLFLLRPFGFPLFLTLFYPLFGQRWELYPWVSIACCVLLGILVFYLLRKRQGRWPSLLLTLALLANPMLRFWAGNAYSDIAFAFFLMLFLWLHQAGRAPNLLPCLALFLVSLRTSGLPLAGAYAAALAWRREWGRLAFLVCLLAAYLGIQQWHFGEVPGLQQYFRIHVEDSTHAVATPLAVRVLHNLRSLVTSLLPSAFLYGSYACLPASAAKTLLGSGLAVGVGLMLVLATGRSLLMNLFVAGYFLVMLAMRPEDLVHRMLIPLMPLVYLGLGRFAAIAKTLYFPRLRMAAIGLAILCAADGWLAYGSYRREFHPGDYGPVYQAGSPSREQAQIPVDPAR